MPSYILYRIIRTTFFVIFKIFFAFGIKGKEHIPQKGSFIVACNHVSYLDPIVLGCALPQVLRFMTKEELFNVKFLGAAIKNLATFPVKRGYQDFGAMKKALKMLKRGEVIAIFPEGGRVESAGLGEAQLGIAALAAHSKAPVLPVFIKGTDGILSKKVRFPRFRPIQARIGKSLKFDEYKDAAEKKQAYREFTDRVMKNISLLKESYETRG